MSNPCSRSRVKGFVRADGRWMVNGDGERIVLRGYGAGNWTNPEGFMVGGTRGFNTPYNRPQLLDRARSMDWLLRELCGTDYARQFWPKWYRRHLGQRDIQAMAELGYNSVRLVLNGAAFLDEEPGIHFNEDTFAMLDDVLDWCEQYRVYAILDLHAAPGGQSCGGCDNGVDNVPHLFLDEENWERTIVLWEEFARRYRDRWIVAAYDLLNEPLNNEEWFSLKDQLKAFYDDCIARIRRIDTVHLLTIESPMWSTMMEVFDHNYDPLCNNWCIHIHNYGFTPQLNEIMAVLERAEYFNVPVWMGEGGNSPAANAVFLEMLAREGIGYALWCWKSAAPMQPRGEGGPANYPLPEGWQQIFDYADHGGPKPGYAKAQAIFDALLENLDYDKCSHNLSLHRHNLRQPGISIPGAGYDHGAPGEAFLGHWSRGNVFEYRLCDHMKLVRKPGAPIINPQCMSRFLKHGGGFGGGPSALDCLWLEMSAGEFAQYTVRDVQTPCPVTLTAMAQTDSHIVCSAGAATAELDISAGEPVTLPVLTLPAGEEWTLRVTVSSGTVQIASVQFDC